MHSDAIVSTSTEMRLTVSPTVVAARAVLEMTSDFS